MKVKERDYYFDNLKAVLIFLVVFGHFLKPVKAGSEIMHATYAFISMFHMPLFIFTSGYFSKSAYKNNKLNVNKIFLFLFLYVIFQIMIYIIDVIDRKDVFIPDFTNVSGAPWYLLAMAFWYLMIPVLKEIKPKYGIAISLIFSILIGYQKSVGTGFSASRIITWFPFFALGYYMTEGQIKALLNKKYKYAILTVALGVVVFIFANGQEFEPMYDLLFSKKSYHSLGSAFFLGGFYRLLVFSVAIILSLAVMHLVPKKQFVFSYIGKDTLQIYMLHRILRDILECCGFFETFNFTTPLGMVLFVVLTIEITILLSSKPISIVFNKLCRVNVNKILVPKKPECQ